MSILLAANNAESQLAAGISSVALSAQLTPGTGVLFPSPSAGQYFKLTFADAASAQLREIVHVTNVTGDTITMLRGQEGTTAKAYLAGDIAAELFTAGSFQALVQSEQLQVGSYTKASAVGGSANAITATLPSTLTALVDGLTILIPATAANTGAATLVLTLGATAQPSRPIVKMANQALTAGDIPGAGYPMVLVYSTAYSAYVLNATASGFLSNAVGVAINDAGGAQRLRFTSGGATELSGYASAGATGVNLNVNGTTVLQAKAGGIVSIGADAASAGDVTRFGQLNSRPGHTYTQTDWEWTDKPAGKIRQWGYVANGTPGNVSFSFPTNFQTQCFGLGITIVLSAPVGVDSAYEVSVSTSGATIGRRNNTGLASWDFFWTAEGI